MPLPIHQIRSLHFFEVGLAMQQRRRLAGVVLEIVYPKGRAEVVRAFFISN